MLRRNLDQVVERAIDYLTEHSNVTYAAPGSVSRSLIEAIALEILEAEGNTEALLDQMHIEDATGDYLDRFGTLLGMPRDLASYASVAANEGIIRFYTETGKLYDYLSSTESHGLIPVNTEIYNNDKSITYIVTKDHYFGRNSTEVYVSANASVEGEAGNVGRAVLNSHSLDSNVSVTNTTAITTGTDLESDDDYRQRLKRGFAALGGGNASAVMVALLGTPGVSDFRIQNYSRGPGTFDVKIVPQGNRLSLDIKESIETALAETVALGVSAKVTEPEYVPVSIIANLTYQDSVGDDTKTAESIAAEAAMLDYIANIPMGGRLVIDRLSSIILQEAENADGVEYVDLIVDNRPRYPQNIQLDADSVFVPDDSIPNPFEVVA